MTRRQAAERIGEMILDYAMSRELNKAQIMRLYDAILLTVEQFDEELLYSEYNDNAEYNADDEYSYEKFAINTITFTYE